MAKTGPKSILKPEDIHTICEMVAEGKILHQVADHFGCSVGNILRFVGMEGNSEHYARARDVAADLFESTIIMAAESVTPETAAADRVKIDALKWVAARRAPKKYGDRLELDGKMGMPMVIVKDFTGRKNEPADD